ncbi:BTAD domain-containing putative transcriptional regulator [Actinoallomurus sp. NPDC050550]|uniref:BTAD domain-containing putative transcriptional regulator n=1 Tax=Actinoallomurus sp. NPDC050550 TaxID=3154937 RepID=UPI003400FB1F
MRFGVLGPLAVWTDDDTLVTVPDRKVRVLLADLLAHEGRPVSADRLVDDLWGDRPPRDAVGTLQARVSQLRTTLERAEPGGRALVTYGPAGYALRVTAGASRTAPAGSGGALARSDAVPAGAGIVPPGSGSASVGSVDADRFRDMMRRARAAGDPRVREELLAEALGLWRGPAYADFADEAFTRTAAARLDDERLTALEERAETWLELGEHDRAIDELAEPVAQHPLRERLRAAQMRALYRAGRQEAALMSYQRLREDLAEELGADPGPEIAALHRAILTHDSALAPRPRTNLTAPLSDLIGRAEAVAETRALLETARLVTLTGPGGVGKTRLALEVAAGLVTAYADGVWLVELAARTGAEVPDAVAGVLGLRDDAASGVLPSGRSAPLADRLADALAAKTLLLVLDNCEHVGESVADLAHRLLKASPGLRIIATSREPLGVTGEHLQAVPPLDLPPHGAPAAEEFSAVRLFVARAAAAAPGFVFDALDADEAGAVAAICRSLDGIPLVLELAATRVRTLGVRELALRLDDRFRLLATGPRDAPARQRTLRAMIDWSWEPLPEPERVVLRRLAVHMGGCTLEAAEAVCSDDADVPGDGGRVRPTDVLDVLARLVDRSLVVAAGGRYRLLESIRAYGLERLEEAGESARVRRRHAEYYAALAERAEAELRGPRQRKWLRLLDLESANVRGALEWAAGEGTRGRSPVGADLALRLVNAMAWYWFLRGRLGEARRSLATALSVDGPASPARRAAAVAWQAGLAAWAPDGTGSAARDSEALDPYEGVDDPVGRARADWFLTLVRWAYGDFAVHEARVNDALAVFEAAGDRWGTAAALSTRAKLAIGRGDLTAMERDGRRSMEIFNELGDAWGRLEAGYALTVVAEVTGDYDQAARRLRNYLGLAEELGMWTEVSIRLSGLGRIALLTGDHAEAERLHERARRLAIEQANRSAEEYAEVGLGLGARWQGRLDQAEAHLRKWLGWLDQVGGTAGEAFILAQLGFIAEQRGDHDAAIRLHREGYAAARAIADPRAIALALEGLAGAETGLGRPERAAAILGAAAATRASVGAPLPPGERGDVDRITGAVRAMLGDEAFLAAFEHGHRSDPHTTA